MAYHEALRAWLLEQVEEPHDHISTTHFDQLGIHDWHDLSLVKIESLFSEGVSLTSALGDYFKFLLLVPVRRTRRLMPTANLNLDFLLSRSLRREPPSVYLLRPPQYLGWELMEEYRFPLPLHFPTIASESYMVYLRQFRSLRYVELGAEYENAIYFEQIRWVEDPGGGAEPIAV